MLRTSANWLAYKALRAESVVPTAWIAQARAGMWSLHPSGMRTSPAIPTLPSRILQGPNTLQVLGASALGIWSRRHSSAFKVIYWC